MKEDIMLEDILGSKNKIKILRILINHEVVSFSELRKRIGLNHSILKAYLKIFAKAGIVKEYEVSRFKIYRLRREDPRVKCIIKLFKIWG